MAWLNIVELQKLETVEAWCLRPIIEIARVYIGRVQKTTFLERNTRRRPSQVLRFRQPAHFAKIVFASERYVEAELLQSAAVQTKLGFWSVKNCTQCVEQQKTDHISLLRTTLYGEWRAFRTCTYSCSRKRVTNLIFYFASACRVTAIANANNIILQNIFVQCCAHEIIREWSKENDCISFAIMRPVLP